MPARRPGTGSRDFFGSGTGHGGANASAAVPPRRVDHLGADADAARAAKLAGHQGFLQRLRGRLSRTNDLA